ncbi:hypothetical protein EMPS_06444 [Entomortierella parvispora]|uniref:Uncharacterized protein n=1 Tax=Entomortierella parvispora TaxID=205924 RepID=A0A9P3HCK8_9FUNG|nr:hypothetical protein EMPS_06444 [Entomortierella parvispora]
MAQVLHLEQYRLSQEAAKSFDDDLDFCPSLTAKELSEIILASILAQKESQAKQFRASSFSSSSSSSSGASSPTSPTSSIPASRAISIVDPNSRTPLYIPPNKAPSTHGRPGRYSSATTPAAVMTPSDSYFNLVPSSRQQQQQQQQNQLFNSMYGSQAYQFSPQVIQQQQQQQQMHAYSMGMTSPTSGAYSPPRPVSRIPIVNPDNGSIVSVPDASSSSSSGSSWYNNHFVAVR